MIVNPSRKEKVNIADQLPQISTSVDFQPDNPKTTAKKNLQPHEKRLIEESLSIEAENARQEGAIGYMARVLIQATMPHSNPGDIHVWQRSNGNYTFRMQPLIRLVDGKEESVGLPYGNIPRLLLAWICREVVLKKDRSLTLGRSMSDFMTKLGLTSCGGVRGDITRLKEQARRLFAANINWSYESDNCLREKHLCIADEVNLWWLPHSPESIAWQSQILLSEHFFKEIIKNPVPIDLRALQALKRSSLALDIYCWLTYRMSYLRKQTLVPWECLRFQFGSDYSNDKKGRYEFKRKFLIQLKKVSCIYKEANILSENRGLILKPSKTHILARKARG